MTKIRPLGDRVLIRRLEAQDETPGGILLPDTAKEKPKRSAFSTGSVSACY